MTSDRHILTGRLTTEAVLVGWASALAPETKQGVRTDRADRCRPAGLAVGDRFWSFDALIFDFRSRGHRYGRSRAAVRSGKVRRADLRGIELGRPALGMSLDHDPPPRRVGRWPPCLPWGSRSSWRPPWRQPTSPGLARARSSRLPCCLAIQTGRFASQQRRALQDRRCDDGWPPERAYAAACAPMGAGTAASPAGRCGPVDVC
jgi:hypothetical protein